MDRRINIKNRERILEKNKSSELNQLTNHWIFKTLAILISVTLLTSVYDSFKTMILKVDILKQAEQEVEELRLTNLHLSVEIQDMSSDRYLEKEARDRLNFGGKGEVSFVIPSNALESAQKEVDAILHPPKEEIYERYNNMEEWISFLLVGV
jgi:cell division protein FtsB